jgi:hypothetical protein
MVRFQTETSLRQGVHVGSGAHPAVGYFHVDKTAGAWSWPLKPRLSYWLAFTVIIFFMLIPFLSCYTVRMWAVLQPRRKSQLYPLAPCYFSKHNAIHTQKLTNLHTYILKMEACTSSETSVTSPTSIHGQQPTKELSSTRISKFLFPSTWAAR